MLKQTDDLYEVDAAYEDKDLFLLSFHADCTPILVIAKDQKIVCAIHSGDGLVQLDKLLIIQFVILLKRKL